jgi:hypothetical protein
VSLDLFWLLRGHDVWFLRREFCAVFVYLPRTHQVHKNNQPQSAYAQHILHNIREYGTPTETITLLKPVKLDIMLIPYEQLFIQANHQTGNLVTEQNSNETNPLFQLIIDRMPPPPPP